MGAMAGAAGAIVSGIGDHAAGDAAQAQGQTNRRAYELSAQDALSRGNANAGLATMKGSSVIGQERTGYAASGVDTQVGSPLEAMADTRMMSSLDAATIQNNAAREAWGLKFKGIQADQQGLLQASKDYNAEAGSYLTAGGDVASTFTSFGTK